MEDTAPPNDGPDLNPVQNERDENSSNPRDANAIEDITIAESGQELTSPILEKQSKSNDGSTGDLQTRIDHKLRSTGAYDSIREAIADYFLSQKNLTGMNTENQNARDAQVIESLLANLVNEQRSSSNIPRDGQPAAVPDASWQYLRVKVMPGTGFASLDLQDPRDTLTGTIVNNLTLKLHHQDQRFESKPVPFTSEEPQFDDVFYVKLCKLPKPGGCLDSSSARQLLERSDSPLHFVVMRNNPKGSDPTTAKELLASHELEWRRVLSRPHGASVSVELTSAGLNPRSNLPLGVLNLKLDFVPPLRISGSKTPLISDAQVIKHLDNKVAQEAAHTRRFYQYSKVWWQEFVDVDMSFRHRPIRIFAENEWGESRPVCTFVSPLESGREIDTPQAAARFVSLIPYVREETVGGGRLEVWQSLFAFISQGRGDVENHALLLCNLLLGFGMEAYVCVGTAIDEGGEKEHMWVATVQTIGPQGRKSKSRSTHSITFWESLTGQRILNPHRVSPTDASNGHCYVRIGCMFNHKEYYANKQNDDRVAGCTFNLKDSAAWKSMDTRLIEPLRHQRVLPLVSPKIDRREIAEAIEATLRGFVSSYRTVKMNTSTKWDKHLEYYLSSALAAYETERVTGIMPTGNEDFQHIIKRNVPVGYSFKGYPAMFNHCSPQVIFDEWSGVKLAQDIIKTASDAVTFAVRARVFKFPENICAVWVMLAVVYQP